MRADIGKVNEMRASLSIAPPANQDTEPAVCRDCDETFIPSMRWGANPGLYRRCELCREGRRLNRAVKKPDFGTRKKRTKSYFKIRDYLLFQAKYEPGGLELSDIQIAVATKLGVRTVIRAIARLKEDAFLNTETVRVKKDPTTWINRRTILLNIVPPPKEEE